MATYILKRGDEGVALREKTNACPVPTVSPAKMPMRATVAVPITHKAGDVVAEIEIWWKNFGDKFRRFGLICIISAVARVILGCKRLA
jgi:hypothetical protein